VHASLRQINRSGSWEAESQVSHLIAESREAGLGDWKSDVMFLVLKKKKMVLWLCSCIYKIGSLF
jgi:hypothetical protein